MNTIPITRFAHVIPFAVFLNEIGAPVNAGLRAARLPAAFEEPDRIVSENSVWNFAYLMSKRDGIAILGFMAGLAFEHLAPPLWARCVGAPTLLDGLRVFCDNCRIEGNRTRVGLTLGSHQVRFWHRGAFDDHPGLPVMEQYFVLVLLKLVRCFLGSRWQPHEIGLQAPSVPREGTALFPDTRFVLRQRSHFVQIPCSMLSVPPCTRQESDDRDDSELSALPLGFIPSLELLLESFLDAGTPTLQLVGEPAGMSKRTLQRRLRAAGLTFSELLDRVRYKKATRMLSNTSINIIDVGLGVGYEDPSHFARAFRRLAGVSPTTYRKLATGNARVSPVSG